MGRSTTTRTVAGIATVAAIQAVALAGVSGTAHAVEPQQGQYSYSVPDPANPGAISAGVFFDVRQMRRTDPPVVSSFRWISPTCGSMTVSSSLSVSSQGKFRFKGSVGSSAGKIKIKVKGKFTSPTSATVTVKDKDPNVDCGALVKVVAT